MAIHHSAGAVNEWQGDGAGPVPSDKRTAECGKMGGLDEMQRRLLYLVVLMIEERLPTNEGSVFMNSDEARAVSAIGGRASVGRWDISSRR